MAPPAWTSADVQYDPETHTSRLPDGRDVPHVTAILRAVGVAVDFAALGARSPRLAAAIALAGDRGTAVHADCHAFDDDDLDWRTVDPRVRPYVEAWARCREDLGLVPVAHARERHVFHPLHVYAGILDGIFRRGSRLVLVDLKTGDPDAAAAHLQTAAYCLAWDAEHSDQPVVERWAVWLRPDRCRAPYQVTDYTPRPDGHLDIGKFLACLTAYREQPARRPAVR